MNVSEEIKNSYKSNSIHKDIVISFDELGFSLTNSQVYSDSMVLKESILEKNSIEFVGCISSSFRIKVHGVQEDIKGAKIRVYIRAGETVSIPIFNGIVDSAMKQSNKRVKEIIAYDELYTKGNIDVANWYKSLRFPISLKDFRDSLFDYIGISQEFDTILPNDEIIIKKQYNPNTLQALSVIKAICQINGAFGIINREGRFEYRIVGKISEETYQSETLFPSENLFAENETVALSQAERKASEINAESFSFYKKLDFEEFEVKPIDKVTIRQSENKTGVTYGNGTNNYIIQGNMFTYGLSKDKLLTIAENIYNSIGGFSYYPFTSDNNGLPFLECGLDAVSYYMMDYENGSFIHKQKSFYILSREMSGIQNLHDSYKASGEEYQSEFITDLQMSINMIKQNEKTSDDKFEEFDTRLTELESGGAGGGFNVVSVSEPPTVFDDRTIYLIEGLVIIE